MRIFMMSLVVMAALAGLAGCSVQGPYGNYAAASLNANKTMADATVTQLVSLYPPAHTRFNFQQPTTDAYGAALLAVLRSKGYSILEYNSQAKPASSPATMPKIPSLDLNYVVDAPEPMLLYRVTVQVGTQSISRAFGVTTDSKLYPLGVWVRKE